MAVVPDVLAHLATPRMRAIWSPEANVVLEREIWLSVMAAQHALGLDIGEDVIADYAAVAAHVDLESIRKRELVTRHDVKARIEEFNDLAGHQKAHLGMTSADIVDNAALIKMRNTLALLAGEYGAPGLLATLHRIPFRGIKGAVGTAQDQIDLLGSYEKAKALDEMVAVVFGFTNVLESVGQVYPRSVDLDYVTALAGVASPMGRNARTLSQGWLAMAVAIAGDQWNEGDVSSSVVRRVMLPAAAYTADAALSGVLD